MQLELLGKMNLQAKNGKSWFSLSFAEKLNLGAGIGTTLKKSVPDSARLHKNVTEVGYARLHKNMTKIGSRLRSVLEKRNRGRFPVTLGYTKT